MLRPDARRPPLPHQPSPVRAAPGLSLGPALQPPTQRAAHSPSLGPTSTSDPAPLLSTLGGAPSASLGAGCPCGRAAGNHEKLFIIRGKRLGFAARLGSCHSRVGIHLYSYSSSWATFNVFFFVFPKILHFPKVIFLAPQTWTMSRPRGARRGWTSASRTYAIRALWTLSSSSAGAGSRGNGWTR